ncbi:MAG: type I restriction-modification system subunit M [Bacteroidota bacterium]
MITQTELNNIIWKACDTFRGVIDPSQYKDYILTMLFLKYVSDAYQDRVDFFTKKYNWDESRIKRALKKDRFQLPEQSSFDYLYENRNANNLGELIDIALEAFEEANRDKLNSEDGSSIFRNITFNSNNLGEVKERNERLKTLLFDFSDDKLDLRPSILGNQDIVGDAYEFLIKNFAADAGKKAGEFYSPPQVSTLLAKLTKSAPGSRICDPTCGSGSLLIKAAKEVGSDNVSLYGQEANGSTWALAVMNMFLHDFDNATIRWGDTIRNPKLKEGDQLMRFDTVVANPPFSLGKWGADTAAADPYGRFWRGVPSKSKGDWAFITHMIETAYEDRGKVGVIVPHGVLFRGSTEGKIRQKTIEENLLSAVIGLPANLFFGTGIPAAILLFDRGRKDNTDVLFIDASERYEAGKNQNILPDNTIKHIIALYEQFRAGTQVQGIVEDKFAYIASFEEIAENEFNLNIPRYVDTFEEEEPVDMKATKKRIEKLEKKLTKVQKKMNDYLKELNL